MRIDKKERERNVFLFVPRDGINRDLKWRGRVLCARGTRDEPQ